jgi:hypothetical protein
MQRKYRVQRGWGHEVLVDAEGTVHASYEKLLSIRRKPD